MHTVILVTSTVHGHTVVNMWTVVLFIHRSVDEANMRWCNRVWMSLARVNNPGVGGETLLDIAPNNTSGSCSKWCACHSYTFAATYVVLLAETKH